MMPLRICKEITINAAASHVWPWIGSEAGLRQWWGMEVWLEAKPGGRCAERGVRNGRPYQLDGIVTTYDPPHQLVMLLNSQPDDSGEVAFMRVDITLEENAAGTLVRAVHEVQLLEQREGRASMVELPIPPLVAGQGMILNQLPSHQASRACVTTTSTPKPATGARSPAELRLSNELAALWSGRLSQVAALSKTNPAADR